MSETVRFKKLLEWKGKFLDMLQVHGFCPCCQKMLEEKADRCSRNIDKILERDGVLR